MRTIENATADAPVAVAQPCHDYLKSSTVGAALCSRRARHHRRPAHNCQCNDCSKLHDPARLQRCGKYFEQMGDEFVCERMAVSRESHIVR
jgi:hypothetical protein